MCFKVGIEREVFYSHSIQLIFNSYTEPDFASYAQGKESQYDSASAITKTPKNGVHMGKHAFDYLQHQPFRPSFVALVSKDQLSIFPMPPAFCRHLDSLCD